MSPRGHTRKPSRMVVCLLSPAADIRRIGSGRLRAITGSKPELFDHVVGDQQQRARNFQIEQSGGLKIDYKLVFCRFLDRKIGRVCTLQNLTEIDRRTSKSINPHSAIGHEAASFCDLSKI